MKIKILSWNDKGMGDVRKRKVIKSLVKKYYPNILCLRETKVEVMEGLQKGLEGVDE